MDYKNVIIFLFDRLKLCLFCVDDDVGLCFDGKPVFAVWLVDLLNIVFVRKVYKALDQERLVRRVTPDELWSDEWLFDARLASLNEMVGKLDPKLIDWDRGLLR